MLLSRSNGKKVATTVVAAAAEVVAVARIPREHTRHAYLLH